MLKFKISLLFKNLKFRVAMVALIVAAIALGIIFIPKNKASEISTSLTSNDIIQQACELLGKNYWVNPNNGDGYENGWGHGVTNGKLWTGKYGSDFKLAEINEFTAVDCTGLIYYTLTNLGCSTTGFSLQNPVPVDPHHWYTYTNPTITYNGTTANIKVLKEGVAVENLPYYMCENGTEIPVGTIVVAAGNLVEEQYGKDLHDHGWIYLGNLETTNVKEVAKKLINEMGVDANLLITGDINGEFEIKTYVNGLGKTVPVIQATDVDSTHWRIESTADETGYGVYINNGDPTDSLTIVNPTTGKVKAIGPIYAFQIANESEPPKVIEGNYTIELVKVAEDGTTVITESEAMFKINGTEKTTTKGLLNIVNSKIIENEEQVDSYEIIETKAPNGYVAFDGTLKLDVKFKNDGEKYVIDKENTVVTGFDNVTRVEFSEDSTKITVYVSNVKKQFDLSLRKFITKINGQELDVSREPVINEQSIKMLEQTGTASYYHPKNSLTVKVGDEVEYTIRVYNEGKILSYAKQITDYLPEGLTFVRLSEDNSEEYTTTSEVGSREIVINYSGKTLIKTLRDFIGKEVNVTNEYYQEVKVICKVENTEEVYITSRAEITNYGYAETDLNGNVVWFEAKEIGNVDLDSVQQTIKENLSLNTWYETAKENTYTDSEGNVIIDKNYYPGEQDDDDFETVELLTGKYNIIIKKVDSNNEKVVLQGAEFSVTGSNIETGKVVGPTNKNGEVIVLKGVKILKDNQVDEYVIKETKAPADYKLYDGKINVKVETKFDGDKFIIDEENTTVNGENIKFVVNEDNTSITIIVPNEKKEFDLSLRKFITEVNGEKLLESREPVVDVSKLVNGESTTATYNHTKNPLDVNTTDIVTYTIRVYNEGELDGYASKIMDDVPEGLVFVPATYDEEGKPTNTNAEYKWTLYREVKEGETVDSINTIFYNEKTYVVTENVEEADVIVTDYLSKENGTDNLIKAFNGKTLDYKEVKVSFKVIEPTTSDRIIINYAQVTDDTDSNGNPVTDRDSTPNEWIDEEDDQDIEKIKVRYFDLSLLKWVTKAIVYEDGIQTITETGHTGYENPEPVVKVDLKDTSLDKVVVKFEYTIRITNEGEIAGYAKEISDYIPAGLKFVAEDNNGWEEVDGKIVTRALENTLLQPGECADVTVILTWINGKDNLGLKVNTAEISEDYNDYGTPDKDSTPNNKVPEEDDIDDAPVIIVVRTGEPLRYFGLAIGALAIVVLGAVVIKKKVLV